MSLANNRRSSSFASCRSVLLQDDSYAEETPPRSTTLRIPNLLPRRKKTDASINVEEPDVLQEAKREAFCNISMAQISRRLLRRKAIYTRLSLVTNSMCFLGMLGLILMIIQCELSFKRSYADGVYICWFIKLIISITTAILVALVFQYHKLNISLYVVNNSVDDWCIGFSSAKVFVLLVEVFVCIIHPPPLDFSFGLNPARSNATQSEPVESPLISINAALGLPMFARLYLICRLITFHSHLVRDAFAQSLGSLNEVSVNFYFILKTYLHLWPTRCLLTFCTLLLLIGSWSLRVCNYRSATKHISMPDAMWLFIVTFTTVGYGDITPLTYCGRGVSAITALVGVLSTALLISVLARKFELSRSEKYVHNFVLNMELAKERKNQAANVIKFCMQLCLLRRRNRSKSPEYVRVQRRLFRAMHRSHRVKQEQKRLVDVCVGLPEVMALQRHLSSRTHDNTRTLTTIKSNVDQVEQKLARMEEKMTNMQETLQLVLNRLSQ